MKTTANLLSAMVVLYQVPAKLADVDCLADQTQLKRSSLKEIISC